MSSHTHTHNAFGRCRVFGRHATSDNATMAGNMMRPGASGRQRKRRWASPGGGGGEATGVGCLRVGEHAPCGRDGSRASGAGRHGGTGVAAQVAARARVRAAGRGGASRLGGFEDRGAGLAGRAAGLPAGGDGDLVLLARGALRSRALCSGAVSRPLTARIWTVQRLIQAQGIRRLGGCRTMAFHAIRKVSPGDPGELKYDPKCFGGRAQHAVHVWMASRFKMWA